MPNMAYGIGLSSALLLFRKGEFLSFDFISGIFIWKINFNQMKYFQALFLKLNVICFPVRWNKLLPMEFNITVAEEYVNFFFTGGIIPSTWNYSHLIKWLYMLHWNSLLSHLPWCMGKFAFTNPNWSTKWSCLIKVNLQIELYFEYNKWCWWSCARYMRCWTLNK